MVSGLQAQELPQDEISVYVLGGFTQLRHGSAFTSESKLGGGGGVSYASPISRHWDMIGGVELFYYSGTLKADTLSGSAFKMYNDGSRIEPWYYNSKIKGYTEQQHITYLQVPLMVRYRVRVFGNHKWYAAGGIKAGYSVITKYSNEIAQLSTSAYFPDTHQEFLPEMPNHGIGNFANQSSKGSMAFKTGNLSVALETGLRWSLSSKTSLYTGIFFDYGVWETGPRQSDTNLPLVSHDDTNDQLILNSILSSENQFTGTTYVDKLGVLAFGLKINLAFNR
jgi:hypothetical protein